MKEPTRIVVTGARGRMGALVIACALRRKDVVVAAALERAGHPDIGREAAPGVALGADAAAACRNAHVLVDFSAPEASVAAVAAARAAGCAAVVGTTGLSRAQAAGIESAAADIPVILSPNMSVGVNCFFEICRAAAALLPGYDAEIVETHHRNKKDAPSGTAAKIARIVAEARGLDPEAAARHGRSGATGVRPDDEIGIHAVRMGDVVGEHSLLFGGTGEVIEITHRCYNREAFAAGAVEAARFLHGQPAGTYDMRQAVAGGRTPGAADKERP